MPASDPGPPTGPDDVGPASRVRHLRQGLAAAVAVQLLVLYLPRGVGGPDLVPGLDKVVHALVFLVPVLLALRLGLRPAAVVGVAAAHAVLSEVVQAVLLPARSGDPWDVVADLTGVLVGWLLAGRPGLLGVVGAPSPRW